MTTVSLPSSTIAQSRSGGGGGVRAEGLAFQSPEEIHTDASTSTPTPPGSTQASIALRSDLANFLRLSKILKC